MLEMFLMLLQVGHSYLAGFAITNFSFLYCLWNSMFDDRANFYCVIHKLVYCLFKLVFYWIMLETWHVKSLKGLSVLQFFSCLNANIFLKRPCNLKTMVNKLCLKFLNFLSSFCNILQNLACRTLQITLKTEKLNMLLSCTNIPLLMDFCVIIRIYSRNKDSVGYYCKRAYFRVAYTLKMVAFKRYGHTKKCLKKWRKEKENCFLINFSSQQWPSLGSVQKNTLYS